MSRDVRQIERKRGDGRNDKLNRNRTWWAEWEGCFAQFYLYIFPSVCLFVFICSSFCASFPLSLLEISEKYGFTGKKQHPTVMSSAPNNNIVGTDKWGDNFTATRIHFVVCLSLHVHSLLLFCDIATHSTSVLFDVPYAHLSLSACVTMTHLLSPLFRHAYI